MLTFTELTLLFAHVYAAPELYLGCTISTRRMETRIYWEDIFGELKATVEKAHWRSALPGKSCKKRQTSSPLTTYLFAITTEWLVLVPFNRQEMIEDSYGTGLIWGLSCAILPDSGGSLVIS